MKTLLHDATCYWRAALLTPILMAKNVEFFPVFSNRADTPGNVAEAEQA